MGASESTFSRINYVPLIKIKSTDYKQSASVIKALVDQKGKGEIVYAKINLKEPEKVSTLLSKGHMVTKHFVYEETTQALWIIGTINYKKLHPDEFIIKNVIKNIELYAKQLDASINLKTKTRNHPHEARLECDFKMLKDRSQRPAKWVQDLVKCGIKSDRVTRKTRKRVGASAVAAAAATTVAAIH